MKDLFIERDAKKALAKFKDIKTGRKEIIKHASKNPPKYQYLANEYASLFHKEDMRVIVKKIILENENTKTYVLVREDKEKFPPFKPGSYVTLEVIIDQRSYRRPYSISSFSQDLDEYQITVKKEGKVSSYLFQECKENDSFVLSGPYGDFHYNSVRDCQDVVFIAGGKGITPFRPMIDELLTKKKVTSIQLLYGIETVNDIYWKSYWDSLEKKYKNFHVIYVLSKEKREGYLNGTIDEELIRKCEPINKSFFVNGPVLMYHSLNEIFKKLDIPNKYIRHEIYTERPEDLGNKEYKMTIHRKDKTLIVPCFENQTLIQSMEENHISAPSSCQVGVCGYCQSRLVSGVVKTENGSMREVDKKKQYIHPCVTYPMSDVEIELPF